MGFRRRRFGATLVEYVDAPDWYVIVSPPYLAVCNCHGQPHVHRHPVRAHPRHRPSIPIHPAMTLREAVSRLEHLCSPLGRGPEFEEVLEALS